MKKVYIALLPLLVLMWSSVSNATNYNKRYIRVDPQTGIRILEDKKIHKKNKIWYLIVKSRYIGVPNSKQTWTTYYCFNGTPNNPYINKSQSWIGTNKDLDGCATNLSDKKKIRR